MTTPSWQPVAALGPHRLVVGIDEVGRGAWAGPVVAAAVLMQAGSQISGARDSKLLSHSRRLALDRAIRRHALAVGIGWASAVEVDQNGLSWAVQQSGRRALAQIETAYELVVLDGNWNYLADDPRTVTLVKADALVGACGRGFGGSQGGQGPLYGALGAGTSQLRIRYPPGVCHYSSSAAGRAVGLG